jgi:serine/threonine-protein kinase
VPTSRAARSSTAAKRDVAIKVLPAAFTEDKERLARFEREAQLLAQLHHPNIASIFGMEESDGTRALVMELVEGPTLAERLEQGPLPFNESLSVCVQIAHALEEAHEKGIVHRDLKPQNIKLPLKERSRSSTSVSRRRWIRRERLRAEVVLRSSRRRRR